MNIYIDEGLHIDNVFYNGRDNIKKATIKKRLDNKDIILSDQNIDLYDQKNRFFIKSTTSDSFGFFDFLNLDFKKGPFFIVAHDELKEFNAVIADNIGGSNYVDD